jgi:Ribosomal protein S28e
MYSGSDRPNKTLNFHPTIQIQTTNFAYYPKMPKQAQQSKEKKNKNPIPTSSIIPPFIHQNILFSNILCVVDVKQGLPRYARVIKMLARTGSRGGVQQVRVEFMEDKDRTMVRNVWVRFLEMYWRY